MKNEVKRFIDDLRDKELVVEILNCLRNNIELVEQYASDNYYIICEYVDSEEIDDYIIEKEAKQGLDRLFHFINQLKHLDEFYKFDGYANLTNINVDDVRELKKDVLKQLEASLAELETEE